MWKGGEGMKVWEIVKDLEESKSDALKELGEAKATMIINYGDEGRTIAGLVNNSDSLITMMLKVLEYYHKQIGKAVKE